MSKAVEWFRSRTQKSKGDKHNSIGNNSPSHFGVFGRSERRQSADCMSETDSDSLSREIENPFRGRLPPFRDAKARSSDFERPQRQQYEEWRGQMTSTSKSAEFGWAPPGSKVYREWDDRAREWQEKPESVSDEKPERKEATFGDWKTRSKLNSLLRDFDKPGLAKYESADWGSQYSRSSTSTDRKSFEEYDKAPLERRISRELEGEGLVDKRQSLDWNTRSHADESEQNVQPPSWPRAKEVDFQTFNFLLQNWPKLKASSSEKRRFEVRLSSLIEFETEVVVIGEEPTSDRWSLGIVDDGIRALGRAIVHRGYPNLTKLSFTQCRMLLESPLATLARAINSSNLPKLEELTFECNSYINNQGFFELARAFKTGGHFSRLTTLILSDNGMQDEGLIALARDAFGSGNLSKLKKLHIGSHNTEKTNYEEFHLDAAREFAKELSSRGHLPEIEDLRFSGCIHWKGVVSVVEALETRTECALKSLDLRDSPLESEGMRVLARALEAPQFSYLLSLDLSVRSEDIPILYEAFQLNNLCTLQRVALSSVSLRESELLRLAALLEARHLPGLVEFSADCFENTVTSALALVRAYEANNCLVAKLNIGQWPLEELQLEYEKRRISNMELDELV